MKSGDLIPIGRMAELNHVSIATLRLYDRLGLLRPQFVDPDTGYRYYGIHQNARLDMIAYMKELGMSLTEIGDVFGKEDISLIEEILARKNEQIHAQINELRAKHDAVERAIESIERYRKSPTTGTISLEYIDRRFYWGIPCQDDFYAEGIDGYERELARLRRALMEQGFDHIHSYHVGTSILQADFEQEHFVPAQVFAFTGSRGAAAGDTAMLDSGMYACIYLDSFDDEIPCARQLLAYCRQNRYQIAGDYVCEVMTEFNVFDQDKRSMFLRLQVPVNFGK